MMEAQRPGDVQALSVPRWKTAVLRREAEMTKKTLAWAIVGHDGKILLHTISGTRSASIDVLRSKDIYFQWSSAKRAGMSCIRVEIKQPKKKSSLLLAPKQ